MAYYAIDLLARCTVVIESENEEKAFEDAESVVIRGDFDILEYRAEVLDQETLVGAKRHCDIDLTE